MNKESIVWLFAIKSSVFSLTAIFALITAKFSAICQTEYYIINFMV